MLSMLQEPFQYGNLTLRNNLFVSPLAGCSNLPFRIMMQKFGGPGLHYCEMVKMDALVRLDPDTLRILDNRRPEALSGGIQPALGAQLVGSRVDLAADCVEILQDMGFDAIDLNCGCPVDKVTKDGGGSGLLKTPHRIGEILSEMVRVARVPISVKIRAGWHEGELIAPLICQIAQEVGATAIAIHGRTRMQGYRGPADWSSIAACRPLCTNIQLIANGDICDGPSAINAFQTIQPDALLLSRATMGAPWIIEQTRAFLNKTPFHLYLQDVVSTMILHYREAQKTMNYISAAIEMRKIVSWYLKPFTHLRDIKSSLAREKDPSKIEGLLLQLQAIVEKGNLSVYPPETR